MLLIRKFPKLACHAVLIIVLSVLSAHSATAQSQSLRNYFLAPPSADTTPNTIRDNRGGSVGSNRSAYDFKNPSNVKDSVVYDPKTRLYTIYERIGNRYYRSPNTYTFEEFWKLRGRQAEIEYFKKRANTLSILNRKVGTRPKLNLYDNLFNRCLAMAK